MDLTHSEVDERFRRDFRAWLDANLPAEWRTTEFWASKPPDEEFELRREWERDKALAGWAGIHWPKEFGGRGGTPAQKAIYDEEMARARAPQTVNNARPDLPGADRDGDRHRRAEARHHPGRCCATTSSGVRGSPSPVPDPISRRSPPVPNWPGRRVRRQRSEGVDQQRRARGPDVRAASVPPTEGKKHRGITMVLLDMHQPGVDVRPLKQMTGKQHFGEVFFTDARVPVDQVLGEIGGGWDVAMLLLSFERGASAMGYYTTFRREFGGDHRARPRPVAAQVSTGADDPVIRQKIAQSVIELEALKLHSLHILTKVERGEELGFESSITKLQWSETHQDIGELYMDVMGAAGWQPRTAMTAPTGMSSSRCRRARSGPVRRRSGAGRRKCSAISSPSMCSACRADPHTLRVMPPSTRIIAPVV